jgi:hypothetical protein
MTNAYSAADRALRRMLEAEEIKDEGHGNEAWGAWQRAATDYWVLLHPGLARYRRDDPSTIPTVEAMLERELPMSDAGCGRQNDRTEPPHRRLIEVGASQGTGRMFGWRTRWTQKSCDLGLCRNRLGHGRRSRCAILATVQ